jgi:hypothetical protein
MDRTVTCPDTKTDRLTDRQLQSDSDSDVATIARNSVAAREIVLRPGLRRLVS